jgi:alkylhydroperoxidase/carboxymuconolactone decarboxylase family protein YurZ
MDPLKIFQEIYGEVPAWVSLMNQYAPEGLVHYTELRSSVMKDGALPRKDKELILVGINAARRYETSMLYHTQGAIDAGASVLEIADAVVTTVISRGLPAWLEGQKAVQYAAERLGHREVSITPNDSVVDVAACDRYYVEAFGDIPGWAVELRSSHPQVYVAYTNLRRATLVDGHISAALKELILAGINAAERYSLGVQIHASGALQKGATKEQLAECFMTAVLTAGIPAWFTGVDFLAHE